MKFSGKMWVKAILKVKKNKGLALSIENTFLEKSQRKQLAGEEAGGGERGIQSIIQYR